MKIESTYYETLIISYLKGELDQDSRLELEDWVKNSEENKETYLSVRKAWIAAGLQEGAFSKDEAWSDINAKIDTSVKAISQKPNFRRVLLAACALILLTGAFFTWYSQENNLGNTYLAQNEALDVNLPDGSEIVLSPHSKVSFLKEGNQRKVHLEGSAFFDVKRDVNSPFIVSSKNLEVEVLGTSFLVEDFSDAEAKVSVSSGKVEVRAKGNKVQLKKNEMAVFVKAEESLSMLEITDNNIASLKSKKLIFENAEISSVMEAIRRHYKLHSIEFEKTMEDCRLTSKFENKSLSSVLRVIENTLGLQFEKSSQSLIVKGTCKK